MVLIRGVAYVVGIGRERGKQCDAGIREAPLEITDRPLRDGIEIELKREGHG